MNRLSLPYRVHFVVVPLHGRAAVLVAIVVDHLHNRYTGGHIVASSPLQWMDLLYYHNDEIQGLAKNHSWYQTFTTPPEKKVREKES